MHVLHTKHERAVAKFMCGGAPFAATQQTMSSIPYVERTCHMCGLPELGHEQHIILNCVGVSYIRARFRS